MILIIYLAQKCKPTSSCPALDEFAHADSYMDGGHVENLIEELRVMGISNKNITGERVCELKRGIVALSRVFDGLQTPYRLLLPFILLACSRLERWQEQNKSCQNEWDDGPLHALVEDAVRDAESMIPVLNLQRLGSV